MQRQGLDISVEPFPFHWHRANLMPHRRFPRPWSAEQAATLKRLAEAAYELEAFQPNLTLTEADLRIAMLTAKLKLLGEPPHTL